MVCQIINLLENGYSPKLILKLLDECGKDEFDFFEALLELYCVVGQKGTGTINSHELRNGNCLSWGKKLSSSKVSDRNNKYGGWLPICESHYIEYAAAFNSLKGLGAFLKSRKPNLKDKIKKFTTSSSVISALGEKKEKDYDPISDSVQPLVSVSEMLFDCGDWFLSPKENCSKSIGKNNISNVYRIQLGYLMGKNKRFSELIEVLCILAQRFVEYVESTSVGVEVFKLLLEQASGVDESGTAELFLSIMLTTSFEKEYSRHQCKSKHHDLSHSLEESMSLYDLKCIADLRRAYFGKVVNVKLLSDCEKKKVYFQTLQSLDFLHQMVYFNDKDAIKLSLNFAHWWVYSSSPLAITQSVQLLRYIFEVGKNMLDNLITIEEIHKLCSWIFLLISHNKNNTEFLYDKQITLDSIPLLTEEEIKECVELYKYIILNFHHSVSTKELRLLTNIVNDSTTLKSISHIIIGYCKVDLKSLKNLKDIIKISINFCCENNRLNFLKLFVAESGGNALEMLAEFFDETFNTLLNKKQNDVALASVLISIEYLESTIETLKDLRIKFDDDVYLSSLQKFKFIELFEKLFNSTTSCYPLLNPSLKLLLTLLKTNISWFVTKENITKLNIYLEDIFILTKDRITILYLSKIFLFLYDWTRNTFGLDSKEFKDIVEFLCLKLVKKCFEILMKNHNKLQVDPIKLGQEELFFYSLNQEHLFAAIKIGALPMIGSKQPQKIFEMLISTTNLLIKLTTPIARKVISEVMTILPKYALHICFVGKNPENMDNFLKILHLLEQLLSNPNISIGKAITSYFNCISKLCIRQSSSATRTEMIKVLLGEEILKQLSYILINEIFGDTPFYFDVQNSNIQAMYLNSPTKDKLNDIGSKSLEVSPFIEDLSLLDENANNEISKKRLQVFGKRYKRPLEQYFKLGNEEYSKFYFNHVALRLSKVGLLSSHLLEEWDRKKDLLSSVKTLFFLTSNNELKKVIEMSLEWVYAYIILCPWQKYEDLFTNIKACFLFDGNISNGRFEFYDKISIKIFSILECNKTLSNDLKCEFAHHALSRLALRK
ncbi:Hypothetical protein SRAE_2000187300 [Strongyloides ratti]|uniref:Uncharacterized protein n=1 Tax=Strongyloides ratti TaxID=34506 RepID=A0A090LGI3_STRRB|nr:Hypothetical protein SRAE_2000187300 [Strongyloides ratti]CEF67208.1 Hypothetical protein SRAE_2000187300 [Strongyloides ratti]